MTGRPGRWSSSVLSWPSLKRLHHLLLLEEETQRYDIRDNLHAIGFSTFLIFGYTTRLLIIVGVITTFLG